jgi:hypothetical protein
MNSRRVDGYVARIRGIYKMFVAQPERMRHFGRPRPRCEDNITMDLREMGLEVAVSIHVALDRDRRRTLMNTIMKFRVPYKAGKALTSSVTISFSGKTLLR